MPLVNLPGTGLPPVQPNENQIPINPENQGFVSGVEQANLNDPDGITTKNCRIMLPHINFDIKTTNGIKFYMTNKVREAYRSIYQTKGYPSRYNHGIGIYSGVYVWLPYGYKLLIKPTTDLWQSDHSNWWRNVKIGYIGQEYDPSDLLTGLSIFGLSISDITAPTFATNYPMFENSPFLSTANDKFILSNWDKVAEDLSRRGW